MPGLFVITLTTLMYEIVLTRIFSVTMWYHFAFVAISVALFGTTVGALIVHLRPDSFTEDKVLRQMWRYSLAFGASVALAFLTQLTIPFVPRMTAAGVMSIVLTCVVISVPFICSGVVVALALTRFQRVNRLYAADLVGAGLGCVALVVVFRWIDGPSLVIAIAAAACFGSLLLAVRRRHQHGQVRVDGRARGAGRHHGVQRLQARPGQPLHPRPVGEGAAGHAAHDGPVERLLPDHGRRRSRPTSAGRPATA